MTMIRLAWKSLCNRKTTAILTILSIAISMALLLGVERIRTEAKNSFTHTLSGTDLIIGARSSPINLLLYSVFHKGNATNNISWQTYQTLNSDPVVEWSIPLALGDSHRGYRVIGTDSGFFDHFKFGKKRSLTFKEGRAFTHLYDAVIGSEVAKRLNYQVNEKIILSHGVQVTSLQQHDDKPFQVTGVLNPTGTPLDRAILISLQGIEALHIDWHNGAPPIPAFAISAEKAQALALEPKSITSWMVGLKSRIAAFSYQRKINTYRDEALTAILPGVVLQELWLLLGSAENALLAVSVMVVLTGLVGMLTTLLTSLNERRREMAILRSIGARPTHVFLLMMYETLFYAVVGVLLGFALVYGLLLGFSPVIENQLGLFINLAWPSYFELLLAGLVIVCSGVLGAFPAWQAYKTALYDGLTVKL